MAGGLRYLEWTPMLAGAETVWYVGFPETGRQVAVCIEPDQSLWSAQCLRQRKPHTRTAAVHETRIVDALSILGTAANGEKQN